MISDKQEGIREQLFFDANKTAHTEECQVMIRLWD